MDLNSTLLRSLAVALCVALAASCSTQVRRADDPYANVTMKEVAHPNGLTLQLPESLAVERTVDGFDIAPPGVRGLSQMIVRLEAGERQPPGDWPGGRQIEGRRVRYRVERSKTGGSGGDAYEISAWEPSAGGHVFYQQGDQSEFVEPGFELFWTVVRGARVRPQ